MQNGISSFAETSVVMSTSKEEINMSSNERLWRINEHGVRSRLLLLDFADCLSNDRFHYFDKFKRLVYAISRCSAKRIRLIIRL